MRSNPELPIGVFDSGVGGLTVVRQLCRVLPREDVVYLGDTARVPYGTKSPGTVVRFACEDAQFLVQQRVKAVVVACNTASAWALPVLAERFRVPVLGVIEPGVLAAIERTRRGRLGVIATAATIRSQTYTREILSRAVGIRVVARACPLLVPLVEEGWTAGPIAGAVLRTYLEPMKRERVDTLVLGCTHYPLLKGAIRKVMGPGVALVDSAESCAAHVRDRLSSLGLLSRLRRRPGVVQPFVTDEVDRFEVVARRFLGRATEPAWRVELTPWREGLARREGMEER